MIQPETWGILVAAGTGHRYASDKSKLLEPLAGKSVFARSVNALLSVPRLHGLVVVYHPDWLEAYQQEVHPLNPKISIQWVEGGESRRESVWHGLQALPEAAGIVLIHDAARPLVSTTKIEAALVPVQSGKAMGTSLGVPAQNTLKQVQDPQSPWVKQTLSRETLWAIHTPQVFQKEALLTAHQSVPLSAPVNDDAELLERAFPNQPVVLLVPDEPTNLKITTPGDRTLAEAILRQQAQTATSATN